MIYTVIKEGIGTCKARIGALCKLGGVSRAGYYRFLRRKPKPDRDALLRDHIQRICLAFTSYGYRPVTKELHRMGFQVNHKRVLRLMREDDLLCTRKKGYVATTNSAHGFPVYPNLAGEMTLTGINQLWCSDITYIRLEHAFVYLAVVLDAYSRRVVGWALSRRIDTELTLDALRMALRKRSVRPGLVHHSDRGVQYAAKDYVALLRKHGIRISMSRRGNPYDNAQCERFMRTIKYEEVLINEYADLAHAQANIQRFIEQVYNKKRLHSALGYRPPAEFERLLQHQNECTLIDTEIVSA